MPSPDAALLDTRAAFDSVAVDYDGPRGNNALVRRMRAEMWRTLTETFPSGARLLDLGCGTGIDAVYLASCGYAVLAIDWSPHMVERTRDRISCNELGGRARAEVLGIHQLEHLQGERFDGIYSNLGAFNCLPDLSAVARECSRLLESGGHLVASVIGRRCPWEILYYLARGEPSRARLRSARETIPVSLNGQRVWTRYFTPPEFYLPFSTDFRLERYRGLCLFLPPPYLVGAYERVRLLWRPAEWLEEHLASLPLLRDAGDHFLMVLSKRD